MLRLEAATGFVIPPDIEAVMLVNARRMLDNPLSICGYVVPEGDGRVPAGWIDVHSQREALLALACLVRYRQSAWALEAGRRMVRALDQYIVEEDYDFQIMVRLCRKAGIKVEHKDPKGKAHPSMVTSYGRMIEGLLEFYMVTGDEVAMTLADRLSRHMYRVVTLPDGTCPVTKPGAIHTHSYFGTLRGLLMLGQLTRQRQYVDRVELTYRTTVRKAVKESGFVSHDFGLEYKGEPTSPGDAAQMALWLAKLGYEEYLDDAERIVRARILPSQVVTPPRLRPKVKDGKDEHSKLLERTLGAYGGMHEHPHGATLPTTDITAACVHTLADIYANVAECTPAGLRINFHLDYSDDRVTVACTRGREGHLRVDLRGAKNLWIRVPGWTPRESVSLTVDGRPAPVTMIGRFAFVPAQGPAATVEMRYALPTKKVVEPLNHINYVLSWRGDDVTGITPNTKFFPFYPTAK
jgi:hypothetical protein